MAEAGADALLVSKAFIDVVEWDVPLPVGEEVSGPILGQLLLVERHQELEAVPEADSG
jgi:hypothetical protein